MPVHAGGIEVVERAYDVNAPTHPWLDSIRRTAERSFPNLVAATAYAFSVSADGAFQFEDIGADPCWEDAMQRAHGGAGTSLIRQLYLRGAVVSIDQVVAGYQDNPGRQHYVRDGGHVTLAVGIDPSGSGCALALVRGHTGVASRQERHALERIAAHLASAHRLRRSLDERRPAEDLLDQADAVLAADGSVLHARGDARDADARGALRDAARRIDRARTRRGADSPEGALALWRALVEGRWSLVERFESDGRRIMVARRNDPASRASRALSEHERKVVALLALGHSLKVCAYELGRAESTISEMAQSALRKLRVRTHAELVELHGAIVPTTKESPRPGG
jgi:DNA-binding CsgD family transcriptional regulator